MNANDEYVATVMVLAYGRTTILNLNSETSKEWPRDIFENRSGALLDY